MQFRNLARKKKNKRHSEVNTRSLDFHPLNIIHNIFFILYAYTAVCQVEHVPVSVTFSRAP